LTAQQHQHQQQQQRRRRRRHALALALSAACSALGVLMLGWLASPPSGGGAGGSSVRRHDASWATSYFGGNPALRLLGDYHHSHLRGGGALGRRAGGGGGNDASPGHGAPGVHALVLYAYAGHADPEAPANLRYFLREAVAGDRAAHYLLAVELPPGHPARLRAEAAQRRREEEQAEGAEEEASGARQEEDPATAERRRRGMRGPLAGLVIVPETEAAADGGNDGTAAAAAAAVSPRALGLPPLPHVRRPHLPRNARYLFHAGGCYDMGMWAHLLLGGEAQEGEGEDDGGGGGGDTQQRRRRRRRRAAVPPAQRIVPDWRRYRLFLFINSSVRGPFLPPYARGRLHWTDPFASRLGSSSSGGGGGGGGGSGGSSEPAGGGDVRLVGPTVSCEGSPLGGNATGGDWRRTPHVQTYAWAVGRKGLADLLADGTVLRCHRDRWDAIYFGELGASAAVLRAGGNLAALMTRYQGVDWRREARLQEEASAAAAASAASAKGGKQSGAAAAAAAPGAGACNGGATPLFEYSNDGVGVDPLEVVFVKVKRGLVAEGPYGVGSVSAAHRALAYDRWQAEADADAEAAAAAAAAAAVAAAGGGGSGGGAPSPVAPPPLSARRAASLAANAYASELARFRAPRVLEARARGSACFDAAAYARWNRDLAPLAAAAQEAAAAAAAAAAGEGGGGGEEAREGGASLALWRHYVYFGQFETGRRFRFTCPMDYEALARAPGDAPA
jgi:hypothetical protein